MEPGFLGMWIRAIWEPGKLPAYCRDVDRLYFGAGHLKMWIRALFGAGRLLGERIYFVV